MEGPFALSLRQQRRALEREAACASIACCATNASDRMTALLSRPHTQDGSGEPSYRIVPLPAQQVIDCYRPLLCWVVAGRAVASHRRTVRSELPEARSLPSGLKATDKTALVWPVSVRRFWPVAASHRTISPGSWLRLGGSPTEAASVRR